MAGEDALKSAAAESAVAQIRDGMIVGLGTGSTAAFAIQALARRVRQGLQIRAIPTSDRSAAQAQSLGIPLTDFIGAPLIDVTIDGADQVEQGTLDLIKGHGGALLREKIVAHASRKLVIVADQGKLVPSLGGAVPLEVVPFGWQVTARHLFALGIRPTLRLDSSGQPFRTDSGNYILDAAFTHSAAQIEPELDHIVGVVEHGFFLGIASEVHLAGPAGVQILLP